MTSIRPARLMTGAAALLLSTFASAQVASPKIIINNVNPAAEIGLQSASTVEFLANGDLRVNCRLASGQCETANIGGGGGGGTNPPTNLVLTPSTTSLTAGGAFSLTWSSSGAEVCYGVGPTSPSVLGWTGQPLATSRGTPGLALSLTTAGDYVFQMRCYSATGSAQTSTATVTVTQSGGGGPGPTDYCAEYYDGTTRPVPTSPSFTAHGHERKDQTFESIWSVAPGTPGERRALPGIFLLPAQNRYLSVPFTMTQGSGAQSQFDFNWVEAAGLEGVVSGSVTVTVSPCPGDFRPSQAGSTDIYLSAQCRRTYGIQNGITVTADPTLSGCFAPVNKIMYLNISTHNMYNTPPSASSCSGQTCGVSMRLL